MKNYIIFCFLSTMLSFAQLSKTVPEKVGVSSDRIERISEPTSDRFNQIIYGALQN